MPSIREQILQAAIASIAGKTPAADRIYRSRAQMLERGELPAIVVKAGEDSSEQLDLSGATVKRELEVRLEFYGAGDPADQILDPVIVAAHAELMADSALASLAMYLEERGTSEPEFDVNDDGSAKIVVTYSATYFTQRNDLTAPG